MCLTFLHFLQVPYHPVVAYLWGAHTNIQVVTNAAWSFYMLKYALKVSLAYLGANAIKVVVVLLPLQPLLHVSCSASCAMHDVANAMHAPDVRLCMLVSHCC